MTLSARASELAAEIGFIGQLPTASHVGESGERGEGAFFCFWLNAEAGMVKQASFESIGCPTSRAVGTAICKLAVGRRFDVITSIEVLDVIAFVGGIPEGKSYIVPLALGALRKSIQGANQ